MGERTVTEPRGLGVFPLTAVWRGAAGSADCGGQAGVSQGSNRTQTRIKYSTKREPERLRLTGPTSLRSRTLSQEISGGGSKGKGVVLLRTMSSE